MHAALKRWSDTDKDENLKFLGAYWASSINQYFEIVEEPYSISLSQLRRQIISLNKWDNPRIKISDEARLRFENEIDDTEFILKFGSDWKLLDHQFWDHASDSLFKCRYSRSKWLKLYLRQDSTIPLEIYLHALKGNQNIIHIAFAAAHSEINRFHAIICDLPWVTSISLSPVHTPPTIHRDHLFIKSTDNDLITFAEETRLKLDPFSTYIFTDVEDFHVDEVLEGLTGDARVLISFVAPTSASGKSLILKLKHSGSEDATLEVTLGPTVIRLDPSSKSSLTIDDITLHPVQDPGPSEPDYPGLSFESGVWNDIIINFRRTAKAQKGRFDSQSHGHFLHDVELLDESGLEYHPRNSRSYSAFLIYSVY